MILALVHAKEVMKMLNRKEYLQSKADVYKQFKGYSKLSADHDMTCIRVAENSRNLSDVNIESRNIID